MAEGERIDGRGRIRNEATPVDVHGQGRPSARHRTAMRNAGLPGARGWEALKPWTILLSCPPYRVLSILGGTFFLPLGTHREIFGGEFAD